MPTTPVLEDDYYPLLFGIEGEERQEFVRMTFPDDVFNSLVQDQAEVWRMCLAHSHSPSECRREMLTGFVKNYGHTVHVQGGYSMDLVLCLSFHLLDKTERVLETDTTQPPPFA